jgi:hypothetical protein
MCFAVILLAGCGTTTRTVFDDAGKPTETIVERGVIGDVMDEMKDKNVAWWSDGAFVGIIFTLVGEYYLPTVKMVYSNRKKGHVSFKNDFSAQGIAEIVAASMQSKIKVKTNREGISLEHGLPATSKQTPIPPVQDSVITLPAHMTTFDNQILLQN